MKIVFLVALVFLGFASQPANAQQRRVYTPVIEPCACPVMVDSGFKSQCGYLVVPENRHKPDSKLIKLPFVIVKSNNPNKKKDPILYTGGGPGNSSLGWATGMSQNKNILLQERDCIAFGQRGTGYALPYLRSYELDTAIKEAYRKNLSKDSMAIEGIKRYKKALVARGIDLAGYNSAETVADIDDLLSVLHIDSVNLFGGSYSGGLMMAVLQHDPSRVRTLCLDSPLPMFIPVDEDEPAHFNEALEVLSQRCETDSADKERYGGLMEKFRRYFTSLVGKTFYFPYLERGTADSIRVQYTKNDLLEVVEEGLLDNNHLKDVPFIVTELIAGNHAPYIKKRLDDIFNKNTAPDGMRISVYCSDEAAYHSEAVIHGLYALYPYMAGYHINDVYKAICDCWDVPPLDPLVKQPFYSPVPALLADGAMDPACAPLYIDMIHHYMPNSQRFLFLDKSHGVGGPAWNELRREFLDDPRGTIGFHDARVRAY
jgi:pimeloyl-ACP methyl ester carboxylesterase